MAKDVRLALAGISGVHVTPYSDDGSVNLETLGGLIDTIAAAGVHNIVTGGNTSEFFALSADEVAGIAEAVAEANDGRSNIIAAVGRSLAEAVGAARQARRRGADMIMSHQPLDPFSAPSGQVDYFVRIADAAELPVIAYIRSLLDVEQLRRLADHPNVAGIKFAFPDIPFLTRCIREIGNESLCWTCGLAEGWAPAFRAVGATGFTSGLVNLAPRLSLAMYNALAEADYSKARELLMSIMPFEELRTLHHNGANVTVVKEALSMIGVAVGPVRVPGLARLHRDERARLRVVLNDFQAAGYVHPQGRTPIGV